VETPPAQVFGSRFQALKYNPLVSSEAGLGWKKLIENSNLDKNDA
jgi:hypothetical protein